MEESEKKSLKATMLPADKYLLTINEAAAYFNVGEKRLVNLLESPEGTGLMVTAGVKRLINRKKMENFLDQISSL